MSQAPEEDSTPAEDVAEQRRSATPDDQSDETETDHERPWDVDPADAAEQEIEVPIDEDEWR